MPKRIFDVRHDREQGTITISIKRPEMTSEVEGHFRTATKETLLGFRALIDGAISGVERGEGKEKGKGKRTDIDVE